MARRHRRRRTGLWLPEIGTADGLQGDDFKFHEDPAQRTFIVNVRSPGNVAGPLPVPGFALTALTFDEPPTQEADIIGAGGAMELSEWQGNEYFLDRIVGKFFVGAAIEDNESDRVPVPAVLVTAGFIVLRVDPELGSPIGTTNAQYAPGVLATIRYPWIWRRSWLLGVKTAGESNPFAVDIAVNPGRDIALRTFPTNNAGYGSIADGPHIDAKTKRHIKEDERLFFACSIMNMPLPQGAFAGVFSADATAVGILDYRLFGRITKASNRGNAAR